MRERIAVLGAGSWGTTIALHLHRAGHSVRVWEYFQDLIKNIREHGENKRYLPGIPFPEEVRLTNNMEEVIINSDIIVSAIPSKNLRGVVEILKKFSRNGIIIVSVTKGLEVKTGLRMSQVIEDVLSPDFKTDVVALSGPSHAEEVSRNIPSAVVVSSKNPDACKRVQDIFFSDSFRVYTNPDITGVELGGALKNIIAIACGISDGLGFGDNTKAAIMTRGITEISRLGVAMGADYKTFWGLSGIGDLITTCISRHSRNRNFGEYVAKGSTVEGAKKEIGQVVEGVETTEAAVSLADKYNMEMPICRSVYDIIVNNKSPRDTVADLMTRERKSE